MNAMKKLNHEIAGMSDKTLLAMYSTFDGMIKTPKENPIEFKVRYYLCEELERRNIHYAPEYDNL